MLRFLRILRRLLPFLHVIKFLDVFYFLFVGMSCCQAFSY